MKLKGNEFWIVLSVISFLVAIVLIFFGLDKLLNYSNNDYKYYNAYVGGDAYNFIINGNYANGFFILAAMFALIGVGFIIAYYQTKMIVIQETMMASTISTESAIYKIHDNLDTEE